MILYLDNYKGFRNTYIPFVDVIFFVGENSTGKTVVLELLELLSLDTFGLDLDFSNHRIGVHHSSDMINQYQKDVKSCTIGLEYHVMFLDKKHELQRILMTFKNTKEDRLRFEYKGVHEWIMQRKGVWVFGENNYSQELQRATTYLKLFKYLKDNGFVVKVDYVHVNQEESRIHSLLPDPSFNNPHLPAIVIVSGCRVICSSDKISFSYIKDRSLYPKTNMRPKFFSQKKNIYLLNSKYSIF